ncbi:MAG: hypothetical protein LIP10_12295 [Clostridiales bacterium]|nr:hypothetical protein [Clostridiales bacterium]
MNAFFPNSELTVNDFPLARIARSFENKETNVSALDKPIAKEVGKEPEIYETNKENIAKQDAELARIASGEKTLETTQEKGNFGEMATDRDLRDNGYERISKEIVTGLDNSGHQGIDGVYYNSDGHPPYLIADAKYGTAQLADTLDGKQMSENWIDKRLDESVGKEKADEIRMEKLMNPDRVGSYVAHIDSNGTVSYDKLDENGDTIQKGVKINA